MAGFLGKIGEYDTSTEDWLSYVEHLVYFFLANKVEKAKQKKDAFLACVGKETFGLLVEIERRNIRAAGSSLNNTPSTETSSHC